MHFARLATLTVLKDEESERDNHVLACNFARYLKKINWQTQTFPNLVINNPITPSRCGGIFNIHLTTSLPKNLPVIFF